MNPGERIRLLLDRILWSLFRAVASEGCLRDFDVDGLTGIVCFGRLATVRRLVREMNAKVEEGDLEELRQLIMEHPREARRAIRYVRRRYKPIIRRLLREPSPDLEGVVR